MGWVAPDDPMFSLGAVLEQRNAKLRTRSGFDQKPKKPPICWGNRRSVRVRTGAENGWQNAKRLAVRLAAGSQPKIRKPGRSSPQVQRYTALTDGDCDSVVLDSGRRPGGCSGRAGLADPGDRCSSWPWREGQSR